MFEHGETLRLQFPKEDLGYVYAQGAGEHCCRRCRCCCHRCCYWCFQE